MLQINNSEMCSPDSSPRPCGEPCGDRVKAGIVMVDRVVHDDRKAESPKMIDQAEPITVGFSPHSVSEWTDLCSISVMSRSY